MEVTLTKEILDKAGIDSDKVIGKGVKSVTVDPSLFFESLRNKRNKGNVGEVIKATGLGIKVAKWDSNEFWEMMPKGINAVTVCSNNEIKFFNEPWGHYNNYTSDYRGSDTAKIPEGTRIKAHWYISSLNKPLESVKLDFVIDLSDFDSSRCDTAIRPNAPKKVFDFQDIDWNLVPECWTRVCVRHGVAINFGSDRYTRVILENDHRPSWRQADYTRPYEAMDEVIYKDCFYYEFKNMPERDQIFQRPK